MSTFNTNPSGPLDPANDPFTPGTAPKADLTGNLLNHFTALGWAKATPETQALLMGLATELQPEHVEAAIDELVQDGAIAIYHSAKPRYTGTPLDEFARSVRGQLRGVCDVRDPVTLAATAAPSLRFHARVFLEELRSRRRRESSERRGQVDVGLLVVIAIVAVMIAVSVMSGTGANELPSKLIAPVQTILGQIDGAVHEFRWVLWPLTFAVLAKRVVLKQTWGQILACGVRLAAYPVHESGRTALYIAKVLHEFANELAAGPGVSKHATK